MPGRTSASMMKNRFENTYENLAQSELLCELDNGILTLSLNRPDKANAISSSMLQGIVKTLEYARSDLEVNAVVFTGSGDRVFSGGADLKEMEAAERDPDFAAEYFFLWENATNRIMDFSLPTVALINGACVAGGLSLALACDIRIATENALLSYPRVADGHLPGRHNLTQLIQLIGESRAKLVMLFGYRVCATEAHVWGLVDTLFHSQNEEGGVERILEPARKSNQKLLAKTKNLIENYDADDAWSSAEETNSEP